MIIEHLNTHILTQVIAPTCDRHLVVELDNDPAGEELAWEVEQIGVVEQDQELGQPPLRERHRRIVHGYSPLQRRPLIDAPAFDPSLTDWSA